MDESQFGVGHVDGVGVDAEHEAVIIAGSGGLIEERQSETAPARGPEPHAWSMRSSVAVGRSSVC